MIDELEVFSGSIVVGGRRITNFNFADDIDPIVGFKDELADEHSNRID